MDQSGPRVAAEQRPLIIERPDLAHPVRRVLAFVLTLLAWTGFVALWLPALDVAAAALGLPDVPWVFTGTRNLMALDELFDVFPLAIGLVLLVLATNGLISRIYRRFRKPVHHRFVGMEQLATGMALDQNKLAAWQAARILHVEHGPLGRVINANVIR